MDSANLTCDTDLKPAPEAGPMQIRHPVPTHFDFRLIEGGQHGQIARLEKGRGGEEEFAFFRVGAGLSDPLFGADGLAET